jgi:hypothetical protein
MIAMKRSIWFGFSLFLAVAGSLSVPAGNAQSSFVTLYAVLKYPNDARKGCLNFQSNHPNEPCDLRYGNLYAGDDWDWLQSSTTNGQRSVIKDLGVLNWDSKFQVSAVEPFPRLKPGEQRRITIDTSGADGADGAPGADGRDGADADGIVRPRPREVQKLTESFTPARPKRDGKPRIDPIFVKAVAGHMYVIHVVDDVRDFYVLIRVDKVVRGDNCTISWKLIQAPEMEPGLF